MKANGNSSTGPTALQIEVISKIADAISVTNRNVLQEPFSHHALNSFCDRLLSLVVPELRDSKVSLEELGAEFFSHLQQLLNQDSAPDQTSKIHSAICDFLPELVRQCHLDCLATVNSDPSVDSIVTVALSYPGPKALTLYRIANELWKNGAKIAARAVTEIAHERTGIDIHPGATIGHGIAIDHGTGIVIGETASVGNNVRIYHGVTLGNLLVLKSQSGMKRHPTIEDDCILYANATIIGGDTVVGKGSIVGGGVWLAKSVPPGSLVIVESRHRVTQKKSQQDKSYES